MKPTVKLTASGAAKEKNLAASLALLANKRVLIGIPSTTALERKLQLMSLASGKTGRRHKKIEHQAVVSGVNNAELLYIHTNGSPLKNIPARPVIEPAIEDETNKALYMPELRAAAESALDGDKDKADEHLNRAGLIGQNVSRGWFTNSKNHWAPNALSTIRAKGSSRPLIDTGALRQSIIFVVTDK